MFHGVLRSLRICQLVGEVCAGVRGSAGTVRSIFSVIEMTMGFLPVLPAGGMDVFPQFTVQEYGLRPFSPGTTQVDGMGRTVALQAAFMEDIAVGFIHGSGGCGHCLLYTSDAADE